MLFSLFIKELSRVQSLNHKTSCLLLIWKHVHHSQFYNHHYLSRKRIKLRNRLTCCIHNPTSIFSNCTSFPLVKLRMSITGVFFKAKNSLGFEVLSFVTDVYGECTASIFRVKWVRICLWDVCVGGEQQMGMERIRTVDVSTDIVCPFHSALLRLFKRFMSLYSLRLTQCLPWKSLLLPTRWPKIPRLIFYCCEDGFLVSA